MAQSVKTNAGFLSCVFCGSDRLCLLGVKDEEEMPPAISIGFECLACDHRVQDTAQATEQVHMGFFGLECPEHCQQKQAHEKI